LLRLEEVITMSIRLYNTLTRQKDLLEAGAGFDPKNVRMYCCGPTVYDYAHIGNARPVIVFDVLYRLLRHVYGEAHVTYVRNITDIDDKINARAAETAAAKGISVEQARVEITTKTAQQYIDDVTALGCLAPTHMPRATEYVQGMIAMIGTLIEAGHAYAAEGHVLYDVSSKPDYGKLSRRSLDEMMAGARVEVAPYKKNPMDFVLWKPSDDNTPGWDSPWGRGRPGWHIECSVMGGALLGDTFDIHGGGVDLMFPHHENEIAQSEGAHHGHALANIWMHNGFLQVEGEKMSKSLGNFITINELLRVNRFGTRAWQGEVLRHAMLKTHYRQPIDWTVASLEESHAELARWVNALSNTHIIGMLRGRRAIGTRCNPAKEVIESLSDDLNVPGAYARLRQMFSAFDQGSEEAGLSLAESLEFLGLMRLSKEKIYDTIYVGRGPRLLPPDFKQALVEAQVAIANGDNEHLGAISEGLRPFGILIWADSHGRIEYEVVAAGLDRSDIEAAIAARTAARKAKNFAESDRIRDELLSQGIVLKDGPQGTTWEVKK
jgi:cysteinyl-tRNA synthetase